MSGGAGAAYETRAAAHRVDQRQHRRRAERLSWLRVLLFLLGFASVALGLAAEGPGVVLYSGLLALVVALFTAVARRQRAAERRARWHGALAQVCTEAQLRLARRWDELPPTVADPADPAHPYAADLDVLGRASLLQLLGPLGASTGAATARAWLLAPAEPAAIRERQAAVADLAPRAPFREELAARARLAGGARAGDVRDFLAWAESRPWLAGRPGLARLRWAPPVAWGLTAVLAALGVVPAAAFTLPLLVGVGVAVAGGRAVNTLLGRAAPGSATFRLFGEQFNRILQEDVEAPLLRRLQGELMAEHVPAELALRRLRRLLDAAELRYSPTLHMVVNVVTAWDLHVIARLDRWQARHGTSARRWFEVLGEAEVLAAFGGLLHDHADWSLPEVAEGEDVYAAEALGHPLLPPAGCVRNDVALGPAGTFLFVTGSNMAGKSTLLRAVGANAVLAQAGGPVCAGRLRLPPVSLLTSMRVSDSLAAGLSFFMAELVRLKGVVEAARHAAPATAAAVAAAAAGNGAGAPPRTALYLLDEILQGTNSAERQVAARRILEHLLQVGAIGAVSSHDLSLADTPPLRGAARAVHFRETLASGPDGATMTFDYLLRPGPATSANALRLVEMVGLG